MVDGDQASKTFDNVSKLKNRGIASHGHAQYPLAKIAVFEYFERSFSAPRQIRTTAMSIVDIAQAMPKNPSSATLRI
jgi:hypothetical protein